MKALTQIPCAKGTKNFVQYCTGLVVGNKVCVRGSKLDDVSLGSAGRDFHIRNPCGNLQVTLTCEEPVVVKINWRDDRPHTEIITTVEVPGKGTLKLRGTLGDISALQGKGTNLGLDFCQEPTAHFKPQESKKFRPINFLETLIRLDPLAAGKARRQLNDKEFLKLPPRIVIPGSPDALAVARLEEALHRSGMMSSRENYVDNTSSFETRLPSLMPCGFLRVRQVAASCKGRPPAGA